MQIMWYTVCFAAVAYLLIKATSRRRLVAIVLTGAMVLMPLGAPRPAKSQAVPGILTAIQAVLSVINGLIQTALTAINTVRNALSNLQQGVAWPKGMISQARAQVRLMIASYRTLMTSIIHINVKSATLSAPQALEALIHDHQVNNFSMLTSAFSTTFGLVPVATAASPTCHPHKR